MQCKICRCRFKKDNMVEVRNGSICTSCFESLPDSVKINIKNFTVRQVFQIKKLMHPASSKMWIESGVFGIGKESLCIKGNEYFLKDLRNVRLNFHPREIGKHPNTVIGTITVVLETKMPHFMIEEPFFPADVTVGYSISGKNVYYHYSYEIEQLFNAIQDCIHDKVYDMTQYIMKYKKTVKKEDELKKQKRASEKPEQHTEKKDAANKGCDAGNRNDESEAKDGDEKKHDSFKSKTKFSGFNNVHRAKKLSPFDEAKVLFNVEMPYSMAQIKESRNILIKKYHPDNIDGSEEMCKRINEAYKLLSKFASP